MKSKLNRLKPLLLAVLLSSSTALAQSSSLRHFWSVNRLKWTYMGSAATPNLYYFGGATQGDGPEDLDAVTARHGLLSPLVQQLMEREDLTATEALQRFEFLNQAPIEIVGRIVGSLSASGAITSPFVTISKKPGTAAAQLFQRDANETGSEGAVFAQVQSDRMISLRSLALQTRKIKWVLSVAEQKPLKLLEDIYQMHKKLDPRERLPTTKSWGRAVVVRKYLETHRWLVDVIGAPSERSETPEKIYKRNFNNANVFSESFKSEWLKSQGEHTAIAILQIKPQEIREALLINGKGRWVKKYIRTQQATLSCEDLFK